MTTDAPSRSDVGMGLQATSHAATSGDNTRKRGNNYSEDEEDTRFIYDTQGSKQQQQHRPEGGIEQSVRNNYKMEKPKNMTALIPNQERQRCHPNTDCQNFLGYGRANSKTPIEEPLCPSVEHRQELPYHHLNHMRPQSTVGVTSHQQQYYLQPQTAVGVTSHHQQNHIQPLTAVGVASHHQQNHLLPQTAEGVTFHHQQNHLQPETAEGVTLHHQQNQIQPETAEGVTFHHQQNQMQLQKALGVTSHHQQNQMGPQTAVGVTLHHKKNHLQQQTAVGVTSHHQQNHLQPETALGVTSHHKQNHLQPQTTVGVTLHHQQNHLQPQTTVGMTYHQHMYRAARGMPKDQQTHLQSQTPGVCTTHHQQMNYHPLNIEGATSRLQPMQHRTQKVVKLTYPHQNPTGFIPYVAGWMTGATTRRIQNNLHSLMQTTNKQRR